MTGIDRVFAGCAIVGGALFVVRMALFAIGGMGADADVDADVDFDVDVDVDADFDVDADVDVEAGAGEALEDSSASFRMVSVQSVTAFFMMFGLVGLTLRKEADWEEALAIVGAMVAGVASFWFIAKVIALMRRLQSSGNIRLANAIGQEGSIYLTVPAGGVGKVRVIVQGRLRHVSAVARDDQAIRTGEQVTVVGMGADNTLVVERVRGEA